MICDFCSKNYGDTFDSILRIDYTEPGKGKLHEYHICLNCRKNVLDWLKSNVNNIKNNKIKEENNA